MMNTNTANTNKTVPAEYARLMVAEDGTLIAYGDWLAFRKGYMSCAQMLEHEKTLAK